MIATYKYRLFTLEILHARSLMLFVLVLLLVGCSSTQRLNSKLHQEVYASLGMEEGRKDNFELYKEAASWLNTPHNEGGLTRRGIDCSGFAYLVYKNVYGITLERSSVKIMETNCQKISMKHLREGDLVFFNTAGKRSSAINHVGIYLKDNKFVHTSTSKGVMVNSLDENYYRKSLVCGGRVK
ncbi:MAG: C40 family peptidase [Paludibacter sp.]